MSTTQLETLDPETLAHVTGGVGLAQGMMSLMSQAAQSQGQRQGASQSQAQGAASTASAASQQPSVASELTKMQQQALASLQLPQPPRLSSGGGGSADYGSDG